MNIQLTIPLFFSLNRIGAVGIKDVVNPDELLLMNQEVDSLQWTKRPNVYKKAQQNFLGYDGILGPTSLFSKLANRLEVELTRELGKHFALCTPIELNDFSLQRYPVINTYGISPHVDMKNCINVVLVLLLRGSAPFCICEDRSGKNPIEIKAKPGDLIVMRNTGFMRSSFRPFHYVGPVTEERITCGFRQTVEKDNLAKYYNE
jgi:hypothetical protein